MGNGPAVTLLGIVVGLQYALLGVGIVLIYKANRFVNFAQGQVGVLGSLLLAKLALDLDVPYWVALVLGVGAAAATGAFVELTVVRRLAGSSRLVLLLATIGVSQLLFVATVSGPLPVDAGTLVEQGYPVPFHATWSVGPITLVSSQILTLVLAPLIAIALSLFFARTETGRAIRAAASNPDAARLAGVSIRRVSLLAWVVAGVLSGLTAILLAPTQPTLDVAALGPGLLLRGLAAALVGGLTSLPIAFAAGVGIGVVEQGAIWNFPEGGTADLAVLAIVLVALVLRRRALAAATGGDASAPLGRVRRSSGEGPGEAPAVERAHRRVGRFGWAALAGAGALLPLVPGLDSQEKAVLLALMGCYAIVALGLTLLTGWAGLVSLGQFALLGLGAYVAARAGDAGWALPAVLVGAGAITGAAAVVIGLPAVRSRGVVLAVATLAVAMAAPSWLFRQSWLSEGATGNAQYRDVRLPGIGAVDTARGRYYVVLAVVALVVLGLRALRASAPGRALVAVRDDERTASAHGLPPTRVRVVALAVSGFLAGVAGGLWASVQGTWSFQAFSPTLSVAMLAAVIVGGMGTLHGALLGTLAVWAWPYLVPDANTVVVRAVSSGALLLGILLIAPNGLAGSLDQVRDRLAALRLLRPRPASGTTAPATPAGARRSSPAPSPTAPTAAGPTAAGASPVPLNVDGVSIHFGGIAALDTVSVRVGPGEVVGLIGGNGAGKSTLMNCVSGHLAPDDGRVRLFGHDVTHWSPPRRSRLGLARSFQDAHLYPGLTVLETTMVTLDGHDPSGVTSSAVGAPWVGLAERDKRARALAALERVGMADRADTLVGELSTGMRRLCELALVVAARPALVLLDEPTAGVAQREVEALAGLLGALRGELGFAVLIVEHDLPLLVTICDRLYALEAGAVLREGTPEEVRDDPRVIASYLGADPDAVARSGSRAPTRGRRPARAAATGARAGTAGAR